MKDEKNTYNGYAGNLRFALFGDPDFIDPDLAAKMLPQIYPALKEMPKGTILVTGTAGEIEPNNFKELWDLNTNKQ